ncbi:MAG: glutamate synthase [Deltaproteobacteria bacterium]|nr:glutamate synthase [Deltaproteobacteria bacterium]
MKLGQYAEKIIASRIREFGREDFSRRLKPEHEGGCGVTGFASTIPVAGRHIFEPSLRMHNRGNGKGGGIAAVGFNPDDLGVTQEVLDSHYMLNVAILDRGCLSALKDKCVTSLFDVAKEELLDHLPDFRELEGLEVRPPEIWRAFVRVKPAVLREFIRENGFDGMPDRYAEDEFVSRNSVRLNKMFYSSLGEKQAFVLSHGRNVMILKIVGYAENVVKYYKLEDFKAHVWIAHQRYPTRGRVWHPGGAHPFTGLNEALVHNGDFANYHSTCDYLKQRGLAPQFMTDTEVGVMLFDLWNRVYGYPLEVIIEALAPTGELDFDLLPPEKQDLYDRIQSTHIQASPDGPWFFIIARNIPETKTYQLIGITDTAMLRPQVFSIYDGEAQIGLICSEKQAIDATLRSLASEDPRFSPVADKYWNARGGSSSDGGAFMFNVMPNGNGSRTLSCLDKFGRPVTIEKRQPLNVTARISKPGNYDNEVGRLLQDAIAGKDPKTLLRFFRDHTPSWDYNTLRWVIQDLGRRARAAKDLFTPIINGLTMVLDRRFPLGNKKRSALVHIVSDELCSIFRSIPSITNVLDLGQYSLISCETREYLRPPIALENILVIDAGDFDPEGDDCDAVLLADAYRLGWKKFIVFNLRGQRFEGCGLGPMTGGVRIDLYGSSGDYTASGIDGMEIHIHGNAQDQIGQIVKQGRLVIHGDAGQCLMYGAKGGHVFVLGNAAGRPLINAAGNPRVVINGTALDFLAESFMAGDPLNGGGFCIVNGLTMDEDGVIRFLKRPYPGSNLFALASGGAVYIRDPHRTLVDEQLNGGVFEKLSEEDWNLILPFLMENEKHFNIKVDDLLTVDGIPMNPREVYRKVQAVALSVLNQIPETDDSAWSASGVGAKV